LGRRHVPGSEVIEAGLGVTFFAGTTGSAEKIVQRTAEAGRGVGDKGVDALVKKGGGKLVAGREFWASPEIGFVLKKTCCRSQASGCRIGFVPALFVVAAAAAEAAKEKTGACIFSLAA
jgi:hypothetical protein